MFTDLPTELIQLILRSCDTASYLQLASACRSLYEIATNNRKLVLHQLLQTPGRTDTLDQVNTQELVQLLKKRSHQELFGTEHYANRKLIDFPNKKLNARASSLEAPILRNRALLSFQGDETVYFVDIRSGFVSLRRRLESPAKQFGNIEVLHTAFNSSGAYVLHRFQPYLDAPLDTSHPFVKQAMQSYPQGSIFLAYHSFKLAADAVRLYSFPDENDYDPIAFAVYRDERFAISWQHRQHAQDHHVVVYLADVPDEDEVDDDDEAEDDEDDDEDEDEDDEDDDDEEAIEDASEEDGQNEHLQEANGGHEALGDPQKTRPSIVCMVQSLHKMDFTNT
jgi:hypothetical protein